VGAALAAAGLAVVAVLGMQEGLGRVLATSAFDVAWDARRRAYAATLELWRRFPWTGSGLGTFRDAFPLVQPEGLDGTWWHAHSDPLELLATAGSLGAALAAAGVAALAVRLASVLRRGKRSEDRAAGLAACGMLLAAGFHELLDFGLTMPGSALTLAVAAGAAAAARVPSGLEEAHRAGEHPAALRHVELEQVEPPADRQRHGEGRPPSGARRHRKRPRGGSVQP
jgi:O-antigen ligase